LMGVRSNARKCVGTQETLHAVSVILQRPPRPNDGSRQGVPILFSRSRSSDDGEFWWPSRDAWGNPIYYRCPGPIHKNGWDLISCGPNGVYEEGQGDDIVVGEDLPGGLPPETAPVTSEGEGQGK